MAFAFRVGTKWCHDFPKLARESGFYFNMHKSRVRVDWNRISNIDIDKIIRERDFHIIDDHINSVIDYCLESEYDVKILDPSFVKLFRLAQLAVEYLLYCKEYLDHSVIILKDELKLKIEENVKLKKEVDTLEEVVKHLKERAKDRSKLIETKIGDCNGEIFKCPHCAKTFISSMFLSAHILRRHAYVSDLCMTSSPIHDHYRSETEKLHNEIKNLKERLNATERVIRNESETVSDIKRVAPYDRRLSENEIENIKYTVNKSEENQGFKEYQEEIRNLKTMLFDEIHNLKQKEKLLSEKTSETNVQTLMNQQEKEFQKLKNQLFERLTPDIESMQAKLHTQENYWKSKIEQLENQHHKDVEKLTMELKQTQKAADDMRSEYEVKVSDLERQTANQSNMLTEQSKQLHSLSNEICINERNKYFEQLTSKSDQPTTLNESKITVKESDKHDLKQKSHVNAKSESATVKNINKALSSHLPKELFPATQKNKFVKLVDTSKSANKSITYGNKRSIKQQNKEIIRRKKLDGNEKDMVKDLNDSISSNESESEDSISEKESGPEPRFINRSVNDHLIINTGLNESGTKKLESMSTGDIQNRYLSSTKNGKPSESLEDDLSSETHSESVTSDSCTQSESGSITIVDNNSPINKHKTYPSLHLKSKKKIQHYTSHKRLRANILDAFEQKIKDLGIDPEWQGIPNATFNQKMGILNHHQKISIKKLPKYREIKSKIIEEVLKEISKEGKVMENCKHLKKESLDKLEANTKSTPMKAFNDEKTYGSYISTLKTRDASHRKLYFSSENDSPIRHVSENELSSAKSAKISSYKDVESPIKVSPNLIKSGENIQQSRNSLDKMKVLFESAQHKMIKDNINVSDVATLQNEDADNSNMQPVAQNTSISPKHNRSVLKSTNGSTSSLRKKKVIFDLKNEADSETSLTYDNKEDQLHKTSWDILSAFDEKKHSVDRENYKNTSSIVLKTAQSDKIVELSRKLEEQLSMVRHKPVGSVETIFASTYGQDKQSRNNDSQEIISTNAGYLFESPVKASLYNPKLSNDSVPQPAPRNLKDKTLETLHVESISEISDLESEINEILKSE
nr:zinc finger protein Dzip1 [Nomia melanderi]